MVMMCCSGGWHSPNRQSMPYPTLEPLKPPASLPVPSTAQPSPAQHSRLFSACCHTWLLLARSQNENRLPKGLATLPSTETPATALVFSVHIPQVGSHRLGRLDCSKCASFDRIVELGTIPEQEVTDEFVLSPPVVPHLVQCYSSSRCQVTLAATLRRFEGLGPWFSFGNARMDDGQDDFG